MASIPLVAIRSTSDGQGRRKENGLRFQPT